MTSMAVSRRLHALEGACLAGPGVTLASSTRDLCRFLAALTPDALRKELQTLGPAAFSEVSEMIREHAPRWGAAPGNVQ